MNKKLTDYVIDLVEILNKQQKQVFWGIFDILSMVVSIIVSYILFYGLINPAPVDYIIYTSLAFLFYQLMIAFWGLSLIHISEPTRPVCSSRMPSSA